MIHNFLSTFVLLLFLIIPNVSYAQFCVTRPITPPPFDQEAFQEYKQQRRAHTRNNERSRIAVTIHIVQAIAGATNIDLNRLYDEMDAVNFFFNAAGLEFFLCGSPRIVSGRGLYTFEEVGRDINPSNHVLNTINIYYIDEIGDQLTSSACGVAALPGYGPAHERFIIMQKSGCATNGSTLAHELGHFFGLYHTHSTVGGASFADGSNCETTGDLICDTAADPNLSGIRLDGCTYVGDLKDSKGTAYRPNPANLMSYAPWTCRKKFTSGQNERMNFFFETTDLADLIDNCDFYPDFAINSNESTNTNIISGQVLDLDYTFSTEGVTTPQEVEIIFRIQEEDNPIAFTIHKDTLLIEPGNTPFEKNFQIKLPLDFGTGNYTLSAVLDPEASIIERDKRNNFHVLDLTLDNSNLTGNIVFPNPASNIIKLFLRDKINIGNMTVFISDPLGRVYKTETAYKGNEELLYEIDVADLTPGMYILTLNYITSGNSQSYILYKE